MLRGACSDSVPLIPLQPAMNGFAQMSGNVGPAPPAGAGHEVDGCQTHHHVAAKERSVELIRLLLCLLTLSGGDGPARYRSSDGRFLRTSRIFHSILFMDHGVLCFSFRATVFATVALQATPWLRS